jgi:hypothetical protein
MTRAARGHSLVQIPQPLHVTLSTWKRKVPLTPSLSGRVEIELSGQNTQQLPQ